MLNGNFNIGASPVMSDYGPNPFVVDIEHVTERNGMFRTVIWTGKHLQLVLMSIAPGDSIGLEVHSDHDQFLRIEEGRGVVLMGSTKENLTIRHNVSDDFAIIVPAGTWHNLINTGNRPLRLYTLYAPPEHAYGTVHATKADAAAENA